MYRNPIRITAAALVLALSPAAGLAQHEKHDVHLHVSSRWTECAFQLDPALTQPAWRQFTQEAGLVAYFRPLADARPMGRGKYEISMHQWQTGIDDTESAWNDTFVHPDSAHWLFEGDEGLKFPGLMFRAGATDRVDVGVYFTRNPNSNYGFYGGQVQYSLVNDTTRNWAASTRASVVKLFGPEDLGFTVYGLDAMASRTYALTSWATVSPYGGVSAYLSRSHEKSAVVTLADESVGGMQAIVGLATQVSRARVAMEYTTARVQSRSLKVAVTF
jgi:hypothetical protein